MLFLLNIVHKIYFILYFISQPSMLILLPFILSRGFLPPNGIKLSFLYLLPHMMWPFNLEH